MFTLPDDGDTDDKLPRLGNWKASALLGKGGQGHVYMASKKSDNHDAAAKAIYDLIAEFPHWNRFTPPQKQKFLANISDNLGKAAPEIGALKALHDLRDLDQSMERLKREVKAMGSIDHPNIIKLLDENVEHRWYVTEFCAGGDLKSRLSQYKGKALQSLELMREISMAVAHLHANKIVHRDIKPENILFSSDDVVKVADFGIVFHDDGSDRCSETFENVGTLPYMPPWLHDKKIEEVLPTFDVFSLAKLLYCLVSGKPRFLSTNFRHESNDLKLLFKDDPDMAVINDVLDGCIVESEKEMEATDAAIFAKRIEYAINTIIGNGGIPSNGRFVKCIMCKTGIYCQLSVVPKPPPSQQQLAEHYPYVGDTAMHRLGIQIIAGNTNRYRLFRCNKCGHCQTFIIGFHQNEILQPWTE